MAIGNYYPVSGTVVDQDLFLGTKAGNNNTVNYTAQTVANYLNTNSKVAIGGQISFRFDISPNIPKTISFSGGGGSGTPFSSITQLIVSGIDLSSTDITIFLNYLNGSEILLAQQNQPNLFGNYKITSYTQIGTSNFYTLGLQFIGGNGTITENTYYNLSSFVLSSGIDVPTLNQVLTAGNTSIIDAKVGNLYSYDNVNADYGIVQFYDSGVALKGASTNNLLFYNDDTGTVKFSNGTYAPTLNFAGVGNNVYTFQNANGTLAFLSDIPSLSGYVPYTGATQAVNLGAFNLLVNGVSVGIGAGSITSNTAMGNLALSSNTTGTFNSAFGSQSMLSNTEGRYNSAYGHGSLQNNTTGQYNTAVGLTALLNNTSALYNTACGFQALLLTTTGGENSAYGRQALRNNTTGIQNVGLGAFSSLLNATDSNCIVIGYNATGAGSNTVTLGNTSIVTTILRGSVGIGTTAPSQNLHVSGNARITGAIYDSTNSPGTAGQVLASTVTGTDWVSLSEITGVDGTGTANYVPKWLDANTITNSLIYDNGIRVGIGTINTSANSVLTLGNDITSSATIGLSFSTVGVEKGFLGMFGSSGEMRLSSGYSGYGGFLTFFANGSQRMVITQSGDVGIGNINPTQKLQVNGNGLFGVAKIGNWAINSDFARFGHASYDGATNFGFLQYSNGETYIEGATNNFYATTSNIFSTAGIERMRITSAGNVGIGLNNPSSLLEIAGPAPVLTMNRTSGSFTNTIDFKTGGSSVGSILSNAGNGEQRYSIGPSAGWGGYHTFYTDTSERMRITSAGNVGIGTTSPNNKLSVSGGSIEIQSGAGKIGFNVNDAFTAYGGSIAQYGISRANGTDPVAISGYYGVSVFTNGAERMRILRAGNVGIGTTSPVSKLDLGATENQELAIKSATSNRAYYAGWQDEAIMSVNRQVSDGTFADITKGAGSININSNAGGSNIKFLTSNVVNTLQTEKMRITETGNVGIGTTTPGQLLDVSGTGMVRQLYINYGNNDFISNINFPAIYGTFNGGAAYPFLTAGNLIIQPRTTLGRDIVFANGATTPTVKMVIDSTGNVGIGTTAPSTKLHVSGDANGILALGRFENTNVGTAAQSRIQLGAGTATSLIQMFGSGHSTTPRLFRISGSSDGGDMYLATGGVDRLAITLAGNVGIGTTSPISPLQVTGDFTGVSLNPQLTVSGKTNDAKRLRFGVDTGAATMYSWIQSVENSVSVRNLILQPEGGNVGIGTAAPIAKLHVANTLETEIRASENTNNNFIGLTQQATTSYLIAGRAGATPTQPLAIYTGGSERMRITSTGDVGIGTTAPVGRLDVRAPGALSIDTAFRVRNSADSNNLMIINGAGGIGVGTTSPLPSAVLDINSTTQGFLPPRMTNAQRLAISLPAVGLMVYCTDVVEGLYIYKSTGWTFII
jgi:hypothetical protein